jgi:hypothetical protein
LGGTIVQSNNQFILHAPPPDPAFFRIFLDLQFWAWSSNARTLDHIVTTSDYFPDPFTGPLPMYFTLQWTFDPSKHASCLHFYPFNLTGDRVYFHMHAAPPSWWDPPPLP